MPFLKTKAKKKNTTQKNQNQKKSQKNLVKKKLKRKQINNTTFEFSQKVRALCLGIKIEQRTRLFHSI